MFRNSHKRKNSSDEADGDGGSYRKIKLNRMPSDVGNPSKGELERASAALASIAVRCLLWGCPSNVPMPESSQSGPPRSKIERLRLLQVMKDSEEEMRAQLDRNFTNTFGIPISEATVQVEMPHRTDTCIVPQTPPSSNALDTWLLSPPATATRAHRLAKYCPDSGAPLRHGTDMPSTRFERGFGNAVEAPRLMPSDASQRVSDRFLVWGDGPDVSTIESWPPVIDTLQPAGFDFSDLLSHGMGVDIGSPQRSNAVPEGTGIALLHSSGDLLANFPDLGDVAGEASAAACKSAPKNVTSGRATPVQEQHSQDAVGDVDTGDAFSVFDFSADFFS